VKQPSQSYVTIDQPVLVSSTHLGPKTKFLFLSDSRGFIDVGTLSDERTGLSFTTAAGPRQRSDSQVRVPPVSDLRLPQPEGPGPRIYITQEQGGPVIPPGTGVPFRSLLRLAGLRRRCSRYLPWLGPLRKHIVTALLLLHVHSFRDNVFTEPLGSNGHLFRFYYSGFQASCHIILP
jgi:hypothetical protein